MALSGVDTIDTHSRVRSDCRPAFFLISLMSSDCHPVLLLISLMLSDCHPVLLLFSLMFSGYSFLLSTDCLTSWLMLIYHLGSAPSLSGHMSVALCSATYSTHSTQGHGFVSLQSHLARWVVGPSSAP